MDRKPAGANWKLQITCPKCGFRQDGGTDCGRCGVVFAKFQSRPEGMPPPPADGSAEEEPRSAWRVYFRLFRWVGIAVLLILLYLLTQPATPPMVRTSALAEQEAEFKLNRFQRAVRDGRSRNLELTEGEINSWLKPRLELAKDPGADPVQPVADAGEPSSAGSGSLSAEEIREVRSTVTDVQLQLSDDLLTAYLRFSLYGKDMSFQMTGRLAVVEGYLRMDPVAGHLGMVPIPSYTLKSAARRIFDAPHQREQFKLPDYIHDVRVEAGVLKISHQGRN